MKKILVLLYCVTLSIHAVQVNFHLTGPEEKNLIACVTTKYLIDSPICSIGSTSAFYPGNWQPIFYVKSRVKDKYKNFSGVKLPSLVFKYKGASDKKNSSDRLFYYPHGLNGQVFITAKCSVKNGDLVLNDIVVHDESG